MDVDGVACVEALVVWRLCVAVEAGCAEAALVYARVRVAETLARAVLRPMSRPANDRTAKMIYVAVCDVLGVQKRGVETGAGFALPADQIAGDSGV